MQQTEVFFFQNISFREAKCMGVFFINLVYINKESEQFEALFELAEVATRCHHFYVGERWAEPAALRAVFHSGQVA